MRVCCRLREAPGTGIGHPTAVDGLLDRRDDQLVANSFDPAVPELDHLIEIVSGVDVHHREGQRAGPKRLLRQSQKHDGVLARGEQQHWPFQFGGHFPDDVHRLGFQQPQFVDVQGVVIGGGCGHVGRPSFSASARYRSTHSSDR